MGIAAMSEAASAQCGGLALDLLYKFGILIHNEDGGWDLANDWERKRIYVVGDVKTADNIDKFIRDLIKRPLSSNRVNQLAGTFEKAMTRIVIKAGDWYAGLSMVQSIFNIFWDGFLESFYHILQWKKIYKDARNCYFVASRLIMFIQEQLISILMHSMIGTKYKQLRADYDDNGTDYSDAN